MDARDWDRRWREKAEFHARGEVEAPVAEALGPLRSGRALDLACGAGRHAVWLAERGWQVTAVDFSEAALEQGRARAADAGVEVHWVQADLLAYEPAPAAYDLVLVAYLHLPADERRAVLSRAVEALAPGGHLLCMGHDSSNPATGAPGPTDASLLYAPQDIVRELPGLTVERAERVTRPVEVDGVDVHAVDALVLARLNPPFE